MGVRGLAMWTCAVDRCSIVALTDQLTHQRISPEHYQRYAAALELEVRQPRLVWTQMLRLET